MRVECQTWKRDSHELFDYEAQDTPNVLKTIFYVQKNGRCVRDGSIVDFLTQNEPDAARRPILTTFLSREPSGGRWLISSSAEATSKRLYNVVRMMNDSRHKLVDKDTIKFGRFRLKVRQVCLSPPFEKDDLKFEENVPWFCAAPLNDNLQCRICLLEGEEEDVLIAPCKCRGSIEYVHIGCLQHWYFTRPNLYDEHGESGSSPFGSFFLRQGICELCNTQVPFQCRIGKAGQTEASEDDKHEWLAPIRSPGHPFAVLECTGVPGIKGIHVLTFPPEKPMLKLGRGHESEVRIPDVSISRFHAKLTKDDNNIFLEDNKSKFGTLVQIRYREVKPDTPPVVIQVGRTVMTISTCSVKSPEFLELMSDEKNADQFTNDGFVAKVFDSPAREVGNINASPAASPDPPTPEESPF